MSEKEKTKKGGFLVNPMISRLGKIDERSEDCTTYRGVFSKCVYFMLSIAAGVLLSCLLHLIEGVKFETDGILVSVNAPEVVVAAILGVAFLVCPFIATFILKTVPVAGALSCLATGYLVSFCGFLVPEYRLPILLSLAFTALIVAVLLVLFMNAKFRVSGRFKKILSACLLAYVVGGVLAAVVYAIPAFRAARAFFAKNAWLSVGISAFGVILATLFLISDFDAVRDAVDGRLPKKYEWQAAFSLTYTVIWLYFEILNLILKVLASQKN
ncbi:MAG: Bax inhibitor-1/YccA family protein [Candidatus Gallimonas sp.]